MVFRGLIPMAETINISIIIRCFNEEEHIGRFLTGILNQETDQKYEIILVDSGSTDATLSIAARYPVKIVSIKSEDFSFGYSLNVGCDAALGEFIVIASAHAYPLYTDWLEKMLLPFADTSVGLVYGRQVGNETSKYSEQKILAKWFPENSEVNQKHPFCNNANSAVRKALWKKYPYDETLTGLEDLDFARRIMASGYKISYQADAEIVHVHDESYPRLYNRYRREAIAFKRVFPDETFSFYDFLKMFLSNTFSDYFHAIHDGVLRSNFFNIPAFRLTQFFGTYRGFAQTGSISKDLRNKFYYPNEFARPEKIGDASKTGRRIVEYSITEEKESTREHN